VNFTTFNDLALHTKCDFTRDFPRALCIFPCLQLPNLFKFLKLCACPHALPAGHAAPALRCTMRNVRHVTRSGLLQQYNTGIQFMK
jgi:hypothetical protein